MHEEYCKFLWVHTTPNGSYAMHAIPIWFGTYIIKLNT